MIYYRFRSIGGYKDARAAGAAFTRNLLNHSSVHIYETARKMKDDMKLVTRYWKSEHQPTFDFDTRISSASVTVRLVLVEGDVFRYLEEGTPIRYATMMPGFVSKTVPGWLGSRKGYGGKAYVDINRPRAGIDARNWFAASGGKHRHFFITGMRDIYIRELRIFGFR